MMTNHTSDARGGRIVFVAHCLLNQNAKVAGVAGYRGVVVPLVELLTRFGVGIVQLRCPEMDHLGPHRPLGTDTVDQYDTPSYRALCARIAARAAAEARSFETAGYQVRAVLGVEGSPSCSVSPAPVLESTRRVPRAGRGIFMESLIHAFTEAGLHPSFLGIPEMPEAGDITEALAKVTPLLGAG